MTFESAGVHDDARHPRRCLEAAVSSPAAAVLLAIDLSGNVAYDTGAGDHAFRIDNAIAITSVVELGSDADSSAAVMPVIATPKPMVAPSPQTAPSDLPVVGSTAPTSSLVAPSMATETLPEPAPVEAAPTGVEKLAPASEGKDARTRASVLVQRGGDARALARYHGVLARKLQYARVLPRQRASGHVLVQFHLAPSGELLSREIAQSSGQAALDEAALASVDRAAPFPPIPSEASVGPLTLTVPFDYVLR